MQVLAAPDGWPLWTSDVRPGREHDTACLRTHTEILRLIKTCVADDDLAALVDLGYEGDADTITVPIKKPQGAHAHRRPEGPQPCPRPQTRTRRTRQLTA